MFKSLFKKIKYIYYLFEFSPFISKKRKIQIVILLFTLILGGFSELISISAVVPFLNLLTNKSELINNKIIVFLITNNFLSGDKQVFIFITLLFALASIFSLLIRLFNLRFSYRLSALIGNEISSMAYWKTINIPFIEYSKKNSGSIIAKLSTQTDMTITAIESFLNLLSSLIISLFIIITLLIISPGLTLISILILGSIYFLIASKSKDLLLNYSSKIGRSQINQVRIIQESLGNYRDIILNKKHKFYSKIYKIADLERRLSISNASFLGGFPRYMIETAALLLITLLAFLNSYKNNDTNLIASLGAFALGTQKLLPSFQSIYSSFITIKARDIPINNVLGLLKQKINKKNYGDLIKNFNFNKSIEIKNINFGYEKNNIFLNNISLTIRKGDKVGIIGKSGSGKSTLMDIIMGLILPINGDILIDGESIVKNKRIDNWQEKISHLSQNIYLNDSSFIDNITMDATISKKQKIKAINCAKSAHIHNFIESTKDGYYTNIGERGVKLSGGQKQRLGIARALYLESQILILDEATSALDKKTELSIINTIKDLDDNLTIFMITHREKCLEICDYILDIGGENNHS